MATESKEFGTVGGRGVGGCKKASGPETEPRVTRPGATKPGYFFNELDRGIEPLAWKTLAKELDVSHQGLHLWRQLEGAPETADLEAWQPPAILGVLFGAKALFVRSEFTLRNDKPRSTAWSTGAFV